MSQQERTKNKVVVILGPTSSGKSNVAIRLAKQFNGEVISADSRQIYKNMDLGTGKVEGSWKNNPLQLPLASRGRVRKVFVSKSVIHHLLDFRSPQGEYNISHFQKDCSKLIGEISAQGKLPIICGGTGFWISAVVDGIVLPKVEPNPALRKKLEKQTNEQLFAQLKKLDLSRAKTIDKNNKVRLIRAIEICKALGKVPNINHSRNKIKDLEFLQIGIDWPQEKLDKKIQQRLETRWTAGMIKEVENLRTKYRLSWKKIQSFGLGYFWIPEFLQGRIDKEELKEKVFRAERGYAKRQRTWLKRDERIIWENNYRKVENMIKIFLQK